MQERIDPTALLRPCVYAHATLHAAVRMLLCITLSPCSMLRRCHNLGASRWTILPWLTCGISALRQQVEIPVAQLCVALLSYAITVCKLEPCARKEAQWIPSADLAAAPSLVRQHGTACHVMWRPQHRISPKNNEGSFCVVGLASSDNITHTHCC